VDEASHFDAGELAREVALVLLEATALPRRLLRSREWPLTPGPHDWQVLLAIASGGAQVEPDGAQDPLSIASALALDLGDVYDALDSLRRERLASIAFRDPEASEAEQEWSLTSEGAAAAVEVASFASSGGRRRRHHRSRKSGHPAPAGLLASGRWSQQRSRCVHAKGRSALDDQGRRLGELLLDGSGAAHITAGGRPGPNQSRAISSAA